MVTHGLREALVTAGKLPELLTAEQVSALLGVSAATLQPLGGDPRNDRRADRPTLLHAVKSGFAAGTAPKSGPG